MLFPATDNVLQILLDRINAETVRIDMSAWYLTEHAISLALVQKFNSGVAVRLIGDRVAIFESDPLTRREFYWLAAQGIPIRLRYEPTAQPEPVHWKATVFSAQNLVTFGSGNYTPFELAPVSATNYKDETVLFTDDQSIVNAFRTRFDRMWNDTQAEPGSIVAQPPYLKNWNDACLLESVCADYRVQYPQPRPMVVNTARLEGNYPMPSDLIWGQGPEFNQRLIDEINRETVRVDLVTYRLTVAAVADALIAKSRQGVPVRVIVEPEQYTSRTWPEYWLTHANVDRLWAAGIPIRQRAHAGLTHMKMLVTSNYATNASSNIAENWQRDHNLFVSATTRQVAYQAMRQRFDQMWNDGVGFAAFTPGPPDAPAVFTPANEATPLARGQSLAWRATPFATSYDVYFGPSPAALAFVANVPAVLTMTPPATYSWRPPTTQSRTRYYWRVVARTFANQLAAGPLLSTVTALWQRPADFDGDGRSDLAVFRPTTGTWYVRSIDSLTGGSSRQWGTVGDLPVPDDYDGDGKTDVAVYRPSTGYWYVQRSSGGLLLQQYGASGDLPVPGDYDGDRLADIAVYRPAEGRWYILESSTARTRIVGWGGASDQPVPNDYDGDGRTDVAVFRPATGEWFVRVSSTASYAVAVWGQAGDRPVPADYDGDGRGDLAVYRPSLGYWFISLPAGTMAVPWGISTDVPVPADFDGDGRTDLAVYRPSNGTWYAWSPWMNQPLTAAWGVAADVPVLRRAY